MDDRIRLAILGCGAITRSAHLPAVLAHPGVRVVALVDSDLQRARALAMTHRLECKSICDHRELLSEVDAVINALPNHLHAPVNLEFLRKGIHVLCEKPVALTIAEARACCEAADERKLVFAVGMNRRFEPSSLILRSVLDESLLGDLQGYDWEYGAPYDWETASGFYFARAQAGGGVLLDYGVHLLDRLLAWFGPVTLFDYQDDNRGGGIEANAILGLRHSGPFGDIAGRIRLSRTCTLQNGLLVRGKQGCAEISVEDESAVTLYRQIAGQEVSMVVRLARNTGPSGSFLRQLDNFVQAIKGAQKLVADGWQAVAVIELVQHCYEQARRLPEPWSEIPETTAR